MKAADLRIGNYITYISEPNDIKMVVGNMTDIDINDKEYERIYFIDKSMKDCRGKTSNWIKPIPLTEEWLVKFGFKKLKDTPYENFILRMYSLNGNNVAVNCHNNGNIDIDYFVNYDCTVELKHVHQLQNLYFALTGKELEFKQT